jgi:hypothetical protein
MELSPPQKLPNWGPSKVTRSLYEEGLTSSPFNQKKKQRAVRTKNNFKKMVHNSNSSNSEKIDDRDSCEECKEYYLLTYLLTPRCRVLHDKLTGLQLVKKFPAFHGTRRFFTALTSVRHLSVSWASPIQSIYPHPTSWRSAKILSTHLRLGLPSGLFPSSFPTKTLYTPLSSPVD